MTTPAAPSPRSALDRHQLLAPTAGVYVSPLCLGAMNFGDAWASFMGECNKEQSFAMLDYFYSMGGNFIDTAVSYQAGESEEWIGEWMARTPGRRDEMVVATKFGSAWMGSRAGEVMMSNFGGNGSKSLHVAVETSLRRLKTDYIDVLYMHYWDMTTSIPEIMQSLNYLVQQRKVLYLGISDTPAWVVAKANEYARQNGLRPFSVYQGRFSAAERDFEREIIPMCREEGMGICPWGALGGGYFQSPDKLKEGGRTLTVNTGKEGQVSEVLDRIAKKKGTLITSVALAYVLHKTPYMFPIVGGRKTQHLQANIEALSLQLSTDDIAEIETGYDFQLGFPHNFLAGANMMPEGPQDVVFNKRRGHFDYVQGAQSIRPGAPSK